MKERWPQALIMMTGLMLVVLGVLAIGAQLLNEFYYPLDYAPQRQEMIVSPDELQAGTRFVGIELILVGALLEIVGYLATSPWRGMKAVKGRDVRET
ncbi:hypothetical protein [Rhizobium sp. BK251]|uniref:hypothetical protein n=1 Tax=Rhizobium sp. BK251 TaxID=2512125 RepID=UPI001045DA8B|nr:hypothetical protein [Rhizobium sp. BK251]TCL76165.1 hypothetical protein EV286_101713 [Rhizobium sp. BK251]